MAEAIETEERLASNDSAVLEPFSAAPTICGQRTEASSENPAAQKINIYIWDMDETLILLKSLLDGTYAGAFKGLKDLQKGIEIGRNWENLILRICDEIFFYEQIEDYNAPFLNAFSEFDDGRDLSDYDFSKDGFGSSCDELNKRKLSYRHRVIAQKYMQGLNDILDQETVELWNNLYELTDAYTDGWLSSARSFLGQLSEQNRISSPDAISTTATVSTEVKCRNINMLVTSGSLVPSLVKCLLFRLNEFISYENVYSSWEVGKLQCFLWIKDRFHGQYLKFCAIGDGAEECEASQRMGWPFIEINLRSNGPNRFPGLTMKTLNYYLEVIYGGPDDAKI